MRRVVYDTFECEVCGTHYGTAAQALACEAAGRPTPRYTNGTPVRIRLAACPEPLRDERFTVDEFIVALAQPAGTADNESPAARHMVSYVLRNHWFQMAFVAEDQLLPEAGLEGQA